MNEHRPVENNTYLTFYLDGELFGVNIITGGTRDEIRSPALNRV